MLEKLEHTLTDSIARFAPWLSPLPTAYLTARATIVHLAWPMALGVVAGLIIECLGLAAINTALELYDYNRSRRKTDPAGPLWIAVALTGVYFVAVTSLTVMLDTFPAWAAGAPLVFPLLSMAGVTVVALRADHRRRLEMIQAERSERSERRSAHHSQVQSLTVHSGRGAIDNVNSPVNDEAFTMANLDRANTARRHGRDEVLNIALAFLREHPDASLNEIGQAAGRSKAWAAGATNELEATGRIHRNENGWHVVEA